MSGRDERSKDRDPITELDPETQGSTVAEAAEEEANQPGRLIGTFLLFRDLWRLLRGERAAHEEAAVALRPPAAVPRARAGDRGRAGGGDGGLARSPYLAGQAIDQGIQTGDVSALDRIVGFFVLSAVLYWVASYTQTYLVGGSDSGRFRTCASRSTRTCRGCRSGSSPGTGRGC